MSVFYNLVMPNKKRYPIRYICFGLLNRFNTINRNNFDTNSPFYLGQSYHTNFHARTSDLVAIEYNYLRQIKDRNSDENTCDRIKSVYLSWVKDFFKAFPWVNDTANLHQGLGIIRVKTQGVPADKVMFILTVVRNFVHEAYDYAVTGNPDNERFHKMEELIPDFKKRWIFNWIICANFYHGWGSNPSRWTAYPRFTDEGNVLNTATFGKASLNRLVSGEEPDWFQPHFNESSHGYSRDSHYSDEEITFGTEESMPYDIDDIEDELTGSNGGLLYRTLADSLSIEGDHTPIFSHSHYNGYVGFEFGSSPNLEVYVDEFLNAIED